MAYAARQSRACQDYARPDRLISPVGLAQEIAMRISPMDERGVQRHPMSDENKMGLVLVGVAMLAFGAYAIIVFIGFLGDMLK
jgi:hypothetical protein